MTCETARELIAALVIDGLSDEERRRLDDHVAGCSACAEELQALMTLWKDLSVAAAPGPTDEARARLAEAIAAIAAEERSGGTRRWTGSRALALRRLLRVAASILIFAAGAASGLAWSALRPEEPSGGPAADTRPTFLVLMRGDAEDPTVEAALDAWIDDLGEDRRLLGGAQISQTDGAWYGPPPEPFDVHGLFELFGYMIISADDLESAREIARSSPHISQRGAVEIWPIR